MHSYKKVEIVYGYFQAPCDNPYHGIVNSAFYLQRYDNKYDSLIEK